MRRVMHVALALLAAVAIVGASVWVSVHIQCRVEDERQAAAKRSLAKLYEGGNI